MPGVAVGVIVDGEEHYAFHGVTSVENPLPVDEHTLFQFGSTGKTFTATAIMRLVEQGRSTSTPGADLRPRAAAQGRGLARDVTVLQLLNHIAGWEGDLLNDTGDGDDASRGTSAMADIEQVTPLGGDGVVQQRVAVAGRARDRAGHRHDLRAGDQGAAARAARPRHASSPNDIMTRRFAVGHEQQEDGWITVARPWALARSGNPAGGMSANVGDQLAWARFHLGDGTAPDGTRLLPEKLLRRMQQATGETPGSALGDAIGISWLLRDVGGTRMVGHGGNTHGQYSDFDMVPSGGSPSPACPTAGPTAASCSTS